MKFALKTITIRFVSSFAIMLVMIVSGGLLFQARNTGAIVEQQLDQRLIPSAVNTQKKLETILAAGLLSMEIDVFYTESPGKTALMTGHRKNEITGFTLDAYLQQASRHPLKKVWLDVKNISRDNYRNVLNQLVHLDERYKIKTFAIIESSYTGNEMLLFKQAGFHTSYYLPTALLRKLLKSDDKDAMLKKARQISSMVKQNQFQAISFHYDLYKFVKIYLEPLLAESTAYHVWDSTGIYRPYALDSILGADFYHDSRVKTFIYKYAFWPEFS